VFGTKKKITNFRDI